jgi:hypothetical protein
MSHVDVNSDSRFGLFAVLALGVLPVAIIFGTVPAVCYAAFAAAFTLWTQALEPSPRPAAVDLAGCIDCPSCGSHQVEVVRDDSDSDDRDLRWAYFACDRAWSIH